MERPGLLGPARAMERSPRRRNSAMAAEPAPAGTFFDSDPRRVCSISHFHIETICRRYETGCNLSLWRRKERIGVGTASASKRREWDEKMNSSTFEPRGQAAVLSWFSPIRATTLLVPHDLFGRQFRPVY